MIYTIELEKISIYALFQNGESALHAAALAGHMTVVRQLVGAGADPLLVNQEGVTPLQLAVRHSQTQVANYLKDKIRTRTAACQIPVTITFQKVS